MALKITTCSVNGDRASIGIAADTKKANFGLPDFTAKGHGGLTMIWSVYSISSSNFDTNWWYAPQNGLAPGIGLGVIGTAAFENPPTSGNWFWEIGTVNDFIGTTLIQNGRWYRQALRRRDYPDPTIDYYTDLPSLTVISATDAGPSVINSTWQLRFGDNTWAQESRNGYLDAVKIWEEFLPLGAILAESYNRYPVCKEFNNSLFGCYPHLTYGNVRDWGARGNNLAVLGDVGGHMSHVAGPSLSHTRPVRRDFLPSSAVLADGGGIGIYT
jgi:hypothetical protein